jgi:HEAT repeat protein
MQRFYLLLGLVAVAAAGWAVANRSAPPPIFAGQSIPEWVQELSDPDYQAREAAAATLREFGPGSVPFVQSALRKEDSEVLFRLARYVGRFVPVPTPSRTAHWQRQYAAAWLADTEFPIAAAVPDLIRNLTDRHPEAAREAERALRRHRAEAVPELICALADWRAVRRTAAARMLRDLGTPAVAAVPALCHALSDRKATVREAAALSLGVLGTDQPLAGEALIVALDDSSPSVRAAAAQALGTIAPADSAALPALKRKLGDPAAPVRLEAAKSIGKLGGELEPGLSVLIHLLSHEEVRWQAALAIGQIGPPAESAVPALVEALKTERSYRPLRTPPIAALALGRIGAAAAPALVRISGDPRPRVRTSAALALGFIGAPARSASSALHALLEDAEPEVRHSAALGLIAMGELDRQIVPFLIEMLEDDDHMVRQPAIEALLRIAPEEVALRE